jgi:hypothetical protein
MSGAIPSLLEYAFTAWCSVKSTGTTLFYLLRRCVLSHGKLLGVHYSGEVECKTMNITHALVYLLLYFVYVCARARFSDGP